MSEVKTFLTTVLGVGPYCVEFPDGEIITTRNEQRQKEIASLQTIRDERDRLREALRIMKEATYQGHSAHWDPTGGSGSGCPACQRASELRDQAQAALTPAGGGQNEK